jgi:hypothetical protein
VSVVCCSQHVARGTCRTSHAARGTWHVVRDKQHEKLHHGQIWKKSVEERRVGDAPSEARLAEEWLGPHGEEPQAGDRDRPQRGAKKRGEGALPEVVAEAIVEPEVDEDEPERR